MTNQVGVLGPVQITGSDRSAIDTGGKRQRRLLAALAIHEGEVVSVDTLVDIVFESNPTEAAEKTLQSYVSRLRRSVDSGNGSNGSAIERVEPGYVMRLETSAFDAAAFEALVRSGRELANAGDHAAAVRNFDTALRSWRGRPYAEFADEPWAQAESHRLVELRATAIEERADSQLTLGGHAEVIADLERFAAEEETRERPRAQLKEVCSGMTCRPSRRSTNCRLGVERYPAAMGDTSSPQGIRWRSWTSSRARSGRFQVPMAWEEASTRRGGS